MHDTLFMGGPMLTGYKVIIHQPVPKMQLSEECPVTADFRKEINQWMLGFFGYKPDDIIDNDKVVVLHASKEMIMSRKVWKQFYAQMSLSQKTFDYDRF